MPSSYSTNLKIELQATGENSGTWGTITNTNLGTALEQAVVGYGNPSYPSDANLTLTYTDTNAAQAARALVLNVTSAVSLSATRELVVPTIQKQYIVQNNTSGSQSITVKTSAGTGITVPNGRKAHLYVNGTDVIFMDDFVDINGGSIDGTTIGANSAAAGNFTTVDTTNIEVTNLKAKDGTTAGSIADATGVVTLGSSVLTTTDINGGTIDGTTIGGSSAAAGTFTTLTTSSTVTLNGGTANGVLYLNGSKVATSGSALTFDGTNLGVGTASPAYPLHVERPSYGVTGYFFTNDGTRNPRLVIYGSADGTTLQHTYSTGAGSLIFANGGAIGAGNEVGRFDASGNLGIGTASPSAKLSISSGNIFVDNANGSVIIRNADVTNQQQIRLRMASNDGVLDVTRAGGTAPNLIFGTEGTEKMRLDSSGNLGIGTASPSGKLSIKQGAAQIDFTTGANDVSLEAIDRANTAASIDTKSYSRNGTFQWYNGSYTERMRLDSSGNLGLGVTPSAFSSGYIALQFGGNPVIASQNNLALAGNAYFNSGWKYIASNFASRYDSNFNNGGIHAWFTAPSGTAGNAISFTQAMTLDASGNLLVGRTSGTGANIDVYESASNDATIRIGNAQNASVTAIGKQGVTAYGATAAGDAFLYADNSLSIMSDAAAGVIKFSAGGNAERARIAADGQFIVSTSLAGSNLISFTNSSTTGYGISMSVNNDSSGTYRYFEGFSQSASAQRIAIYTNGDVKNTNGVFAAFSDVKLKKDIVDAGSQWDDIKALRVRKYKLKNDTSDVVQIGLIAQEVEQVSPGLVNESQDETRDEEGKIVLTGEVTKGVKYSILYMKAVKALQEAMARIETLEAKVTALESK